MKNDILLLLLGFFTFSCSNEILEDQPNHTPEQPQKQPQQPDKVGQAVDFINHVFVDQPLTSSVGGVGSQAGMLSQSSIDTIYDLRDANKNPLLQLVVFKPKAYALISVIKNVPNPPVLFYSKAKFDINNPSIGLVHYLREFWAKVRSKVKDKAGPILTHQLISKDPVAKTATYKGTKFVGSDPEKITKQVGPLLKTYWDQNPPFNNTVVKNKGAGMKVGCVAVAVGQIMAYHRKNNLKTYNWSRILYDNNDTIKKAGGAADFLYDVAEGVNTSYNTVKSTSNSANAKKLFCRAGYTVSAIKAYDYNTVKSELDASRPVYLGGYRTRSYNGDLWWLFHGTKFKYSDGHDWVTDGYKITEIQPYFEDEYLQINTVTCQTIFRMAAGPVYKGRKRITKYLHMNWGWGHSGQKDSAWSTYNYWVDKTVDPRRIYRYKKEMMTVQK